MIFLHISNEHMESLKNIITGDFPGGPESKTLHSQCRRLRFDPWLGNQILYAAAKTWHGQINKYLLKNPKHYNSIPKHKILRDKSNYFKHTFKKLLIFNWRIIALQYCVSFCQTSTSVSSLALEPPSHLPPLKHTFLTVLKLRAVINQNP